MSIFTVSFFNRSLSFVTSFMCVYAFANPDLERIWEFHPAFDQKDYAFLSFYKVPSYTFYSNIGKIYIFTPTNI